MTGETDDLIEPFRTSVWDTQPPLSGIGLKGWDPIRNSRASIKRFTEVSVWRSMFSTYYKNDHVFSTSHRCNHFGTENYVERPFYLSWLLPTVTTDVLDMAYLDASQTYGDAFYHLIHEKFFTLGIARALLESNPTLVIVVDVLLPKLVEFAELIGIPESRFYQVSGAIKVKTLYVPFAIDCTVMASPHVLLTRNWIRDLHAHHYATSFATDVVLINRNENGKCKRCLINSEEVFTALQHAFPTRKVHHVILGDLTTRQVMALFSRTELVVGPHGAGFVHLVFLPDHGKVVEVLNNPFACNLLFYELSLVLGLKYHGIGPLQISPKEVDFSRVDVDVVVSVARRMLTV